MSRLGPLLLLSILLVLGCRPTPLTPPVAPTSVQASPAIQGQLLLPGGYETQSNATQVRANATVTLIDPVSFQAKATGITAADGTFTVQAPGSFTPVLGALYMLESSKTLGGTSNALFRLRTLVQLNAGGWTSVSGTTIQLSSATTAVAILWDQLGLSASDVVGKVTYDATTRTHRFSDLTATLSESKVREVDGLVGQALLLNMDPLQLVRPGLNGSFQLSLGDRSRNLLVNAGVEEASSTGWSFYNPVSVGTYSLVTTSPYEGRQALKVTATAPGDVWFGQGTAGPNPAVGLSFVAGRTYSFSIYARGAVGGEKLQLQMSPMDTTGTRFNSYVTLTTSWQRYTLTFTPTSTTAMGIVLVRPGSVANETTFPATVYVDAFQFEEGGRASDFASPGTLRLDGFANAPESVGTTPTAGLRGRGVRVDAGANLLTNSSFEVDSNADGLPDNMDTAGGTVSVALDSTSAWFGARALRQTLTSPSPGYMRYPLTYAFKAGTTYTFSVWVRGQGISGSSNSDFGLYIDAFRVGGGLESFTSPAPTGTFDWTRISVSYTFLKDCGSANVIPIFRNKTGTAWFDGLQVESGSRATPYGGEGGALDKLTFDAGRNVNQGQGTISFWYRPEFSWDEGNSFIFGITRADTDMDICDVDTYRGANGQPQLRFQVHDGTLWHTNAVWQPSSAPWQVGSWHHVATTWGPRGLELYWDGVLVASDAYSGPMFPISTLGRLLFSGPAGNFAVNANGTFDGLKVWDTQKPATWVGREFLGVSQ